MFSQREIVLVPFPYSDLSSAKKRPVLIVSNNQYNAEYGDVVVVVISSVVRSGDEYSILLSELDLEYGILPEASTIKVHKLFTIDKNRIIKKFSLLKRDKFAQVYEALKALFSEQ
jgi:mRNA interferase MazF